VSPVSLALAVVAAGCNALSSVLQRRANREETQPFGRRMLLDLVHHPVWLGGFAALIASFLLQATALRFGPLAVVEPILAFELPLTLLLAGFVLKVRVGHRDAGTAVAMAAALALFLVALGPTEDPAASASTGPVVLAALVTVGAVAALVLVGYFGPRRYSAALYGAAAGCGFGLAAAMMKLSVGRPGAGPTAVLGTWELYAMAAAGVGALVLVQAALRCGTLVAVQPGLTVLDPVVSVVWGTAVLGERTNTGPVLVLAAVAVAGLVVAAVVLSRSPALGGHRPSSDRAAAGQAR
jgi:drug/metabolite transporter (DMT)-like permease